MKREVTLSITGLHDVSDAEGTDSITAVENGEYFKKQDAHYVLYGAEEQRGQHGKCSKNRLKFGQGRAELWRRGAVETRMIFEENRVHTMCLKSPSGNLFLDVRTDRVALEESQDCIVLRIAYALEADGQTVSECKVKVEIREKQ